MSQTKGEDLQTFLTKMLCELPDNLDVPIFRLPYHERKKELCHPKVVSIRPYHRGKQGLRTMEYQKGFTLRGFLAHNKNVSLEFYLQQLKSLEAEARRCYCEPVDLGSDEFVKMLLLDGCFILEWLSSFLTGDYSFFDTGWNILDIIYDLLLIENQVPFFVLHCLLAIQNKGVEWSRCCMSQPCPLFNLMNNSLRNTNFHHSVVFMPIKSEDFECSRIGHLLHFYYKGVVTEITRPRSPETQSDRGSKSHSFPCFTLFSKSSKSASDYPPQTPSEQGISHNLCHPDSFTILKLFSRSIERASDNNKKSNCLRFDKLDRKEIQLMCVSELCDAAVKFKKKKDPICIFDISFENGTIEMPFLKIDRHFVRLMWNMVAYEQGKAGECWKSPLSSYLALMDSLIDTEKDIDLLERAGIVDNYFSNAEEAAVFFNQFGNFFFLNYENHHFHEVFQNVKNYTESTWPKYRARLMQDYFSSPWSFISVVAAIALFALTILQTYFSAMSV